MATQYLCPNKECNPLLPLFGKVYLKRKRIPKRGELYCSKCKAHFDEELMGKDGKETHKKSCGGKLKQAYVYALICEKCGKGN